MILFLHGFNSSGACKKCQLLESKSDTSIIPSLDLLNITLSLETLEKILQESDIDLIIGASFGGFYAHYLSKKYDKKLLLINPIVNPLDFIEDISVGGLDKTALISKIEKIRLYNEKHHFTQAVEVLFGLDDDVVDYKKSRELFKQFPCKFYKDDHSLLKGFEDYLKQNSRLL